MRRSDINKYKPGDVFAVSGFGSTSKNLELQWKGNTTYTYLIDDGVDVSMFSDYLSEQEVLVPPGTIFRVDAKRQQGDKNVVAFSKITRKAKKLQDRPKDELVNSYLTNVKQNMETQAEDYEKFKG